MSQEEQSSSGFLGGLFQPGVSSRIILSLKEELLVKQNQYHSPKKFQAKNDEAEPNPPPECPFHRPAASASKQEEPKVEQKKPEKVQEKEPEKVLQGEKPEKVLQ